ncbi:hypothetical protein [Ureibacillus sinduriensis]|uniref:Uncharacterized protein n=1 Tax=Ureibacillus sinduriensis BLB-1 = JCM 15800 TaxID=1384057 RepID=A0A0A3I0I9_9BACL|nr:hypothetical protein [Ureibacillus sinduriensis]KGR76153.1 hypothetical protein CD33_08250 [Ureibacillus sinduriensis BLB-1 = JCM 15800]
MSNRWFASLLFVVAISLPSHAHAEAGLTNITKTLTDTAQQTVNQSILSDSSNADSASSEDEPSNEPNSESIGSGLPLVKVEISASTDSLKGDVLETETDPVTKAPSVKTSATLGNAKMSVDTQSIQVKIPVAEASVSSETPSVNVSTVLGNSEITADTQDIKVETPVAVVEVSTKNPSVKLNTTLEDAEVSVIPEDNKVELPLLKTGISAETPPVKTEFATEVPSVKVETPSSNADVSLDQKEKIEQSKNPTIPILHEDWDNVLPIFPFQQKDGHRTIEPDFTPSSITMVTGHREQPTSIFGKLGQEQYSHDSTDNPKKPGTQSFMILDKNNYVSPGHQPASPLTFYNGQGTSCTSHIGSTSFTATGILLTMNLSEAKLNSRMTKETKLYYDDWLNAPPTKPPQSSFFLQNLKDTI